MHPDMVFFGKRDAFRENQQGEGFWACVPKQYFLEKGMHFGNTHRKGAFGIASQNSISWKKGCTISGSLLGKYELTIREIFTFSYEESFIRRMKDER